MDSLREKGLTGLYAFMDMDSLREKGLTGLYAFMDPEYSGREKGSPPRCIL